MFGDKPADVSPQFADFRMNPVFDSKLQYPDLPGSVAKVAAYPVHFDQERQMWFCDMAIDPKNIYFPFIKLMLARYQPHSVREENADVCLSPVVATKFTQLLPERKSTLSFKKDDLNSKFTLTVEGPVYSPGNTPYGNYSFLKISFLDTKLAQPVYGVVDDGKNEKDMKDEGVTVNIDRKVLQGTSYFKIEKDFRLPRKYKSTPFQVIVEEYERGPNRMPGLPDAYKDRLEQSEQTDRLVYADVFKINETVK
jgi:hypothetical protein